VVAEVREGLNPQGMNSQTDQSDLRYSEHRPSASPPPKIKLIMTYLTGSPPRCAMQDKPRFMDQVRTAIRVRHYSRRTEEAYVAWIRRFIIFNGKRHPSEMGAEEVSRFLSSLATERRVSASTRNQALSGILFLYREVLRQDLPWLDDLVRAKRPQRLPVVFTRDEARRVLGQLNGTHWLMAALCPPAPKMKAFGSCSAPRPILTLTGYEPFS